MRKSNCLELNPFFFIFKELTAKYQPQRLNFEQLIILKFHKKMKSYNVTYMILSSIHFVLPEMTEMGDSPFCFNILTGHSNLITFILLLWFDDSLAHTILIR